MSNNPATTFPRRIYAADRLSHIPVPEEVILRYRNMIFKLALNYAVAFRVRSVLDDLYQEGIIQLLYAYRKYPTSNSTCSPITYYYEWARHGMSRFMYRNHSVVRLNQNSSRMKSYWAGEIPYDIPLDAPLRKAPNMCAMDVVKDPHNSDPEEVTGRKLAYEQFNHIVAAFRRKQKGINKKIIDLRMLSDEPLKLSELGKMFGLSPWAINKRELDMRVKLRKMVDRKGLTLADFI